ncbi:MAG: RidA family protein [Gemmatimonadales bacterium]|nr:RidA family protein [Gemmatimonadales bacterium]
MAGAARLSNPVPRPGWPDAKEEVSVGRKAINSPEYHVPIDGFAHIIAAEGDTSTLYVSGLTSRTADGTIVGIDDMAAQARQVLVNMANVLDSAGATLDDVVQIRTYVTDITLWDVIEPVWREQWGDVWPASTLVQIERLFDPRQMIEMEAIARIGSP